MHIIKSLITCSSQKTSGAKEKSVSGADRWSFNTDILLSVFQKSTKVKPEAHSISAGAANRPTASQGERHQRAHTKHIIYTQQRRSEKAIKRSSSRKERLTFFWAALHSGALGGSFVWNKKKSSALCIILSMNAFKRAAFFSLFTPSDKTVDFRLRTGKKESIIATVRAFGLCILRLVGGNSLRPSPADKFVTAIVRQNTRGPFTDSVCMCIATCCSLSARLLLISGLTSLSGYLLIILAVRRVEL
jgi:hypothetical protein